jgi:hypothetical protein
MATIAILHEQNFFTKFFYLIFICLNSEQHKIPKDAKPKNIFPGIVSPVQNVHGL